MLDCLLYLHRKREPRFIPPNKAKLSKDGKTILDYKDYPLFLAPYSRSFKGKISKDQLGQYVLLLKKDADKMGVSCTFTLESNFLLGSLEPKLDIKLFIRAIIF